MELIKHTEKCITLSNSDEICDCGMDNIFNWQRAARELQTKLAAAEERAEKAERERDDEKRKHDDWRGAAATNWELACQYERERDEAEQRAGRLEEALQQIAAWNFDIAGDCVADAQQLARAALAQQQAEDEK